MSKKSLIPILIIIILAIAIYVLRNNDKSKTVVPKDKTRKSETTSVNRDRGFDRRTSLLKYSKHAACRMSCREISKNEVEEIMLDGSINYKKSDISNARCPRYALEGNTDDGQRVRIVYAQCNDSTTVVTVIDLGTDHVCDCPGDDEKFKNRK